MIGFLRAVKALSLARTATAMFSTAMDAPSGKLAHSPLALNDNHFTFPSSMWSKRISVTELRHVIPEGKYKGSTVLGLLVYSLTKPKSKDNADFQNEFDHMWDRFKDQFTAHDFLAPSLNGTTVLWQLTRIAHVNDKYFQFVLNKFNDKLSFTGHCTAGRYQGISPFWNLIYSTLQSGSPLFKEVWEQHKTQITPNDLLATSQGQFQTGSSILQLLISAACVYPEYADIVEEILEQVPSILCEESLSSMPSDMHTLPLQEIINSSMHLNNKLTPLIQIRHNFFNAYKKLALELDSGFILDDSRWSAICTEAAAAQNRGYLNAFYDIATLVSDRYPDHAAEALQRVPKESWNYSKLVNQDELAVVAFEHNSYLPSRSTEPTDSRLVEAPPPSFTQKLRK